MPDKEIFVLKIVWRKSIVSLHRLTQAVQHANLRRTAGDPTWVVFIFFLPKVGDNEITNFSSRPFTFNVKQQDSKFIML